MQAIHTQSQEYGARICCSQQEQKVCEQMLEWYRIEFDWWRVCQRQPSIKLFDPIYRMRELDRDGEM